MESTTYRSEVVTKSQQNIRLKNYSMRQFKTEYNI